MLIAPNKTQIQLLRDSTLFNEAQGSNVQEVLYAAAWIVGEFAGYLFAFVLLFKFESINTYLFSSYSRNYVELMEVLLQPRVTSLPAEIQVFYQGH